VRASNSPAISLGASSFKGALGFIRWHYSGDEGEGKAMQENQRVAHMADEVLARQARARAERTGESFEDALKVVLKTEAGRQLAELRDGPHGGRKAGQWQESLGHLRERVRDEESRQGH
jgi:hypothetical protein